MASWVHELNKHKGKGKENDTKETELKNIVFNIATVCLKARTLGSKREKEIA